MIEIAYAICAFILLPHVDNATEYNFYIEGEYVTTLQHPDNIVEVCRNDYPFIQECTPEQGCGVVIDYQYTASNSTSTSELSPTLTVHWVHDADYDDDGVVGWSDFTYFGSQFGSTNPTCDADGSGVVGFLDFSAFAKRYGECLSENLVKVVPCG